MYLTNTNDDLLSLLSQVAAETDLEKLGQLQVDIATNIRNNHYGVPMVVLDEQYGVNPDKITQWDLSKFVYDPNYRDIAVQGRAYPGE